MSCISTKYTPIARTGKTAPLQQQHSRRVRGFDLVRPALLLPHLAQFHLYYSCQGDSNTAAADVL